MGDYKIIITPSATKELDKLDNILLNRIFPKIKLLSKEQRPIGCQKIKGEKNLWRIRIGVYRIIYSIDDKKQIVDIVSIRHRSKAYR